MASRAQMLEAVKEFRSSDVKAILKEQPGLISYRDDRGRNFLHICCGVNVEEKKLAPLQSIRTADVLLNAGLDLNQEAFREHDWRATPLWYAVSRGRNLKLAEHLLQRGSDPNHCLWAAAYKEDIDTIELLIRHGADIDPVTEDETPFLSAVKWSHFHSAQVLLEHGADVNFQDSRGMSALHYMLKKGSDKRHFQTMLRYGARGDLKNAEGHTAAEMMARKRDPEFKSMCSALSSPSGRTKGRAPSTRRSSASGASHGRSTS